jgi:hypothetical protein
VAVDARMLPFYEIQSAVTKTSVSRYKNISQPLQKHQSAVTKTSVSRYKNMSTHREQGDNLCQKRPGHDSSLFETAPGFF